MQSNSDATQRFTDRVDDYAQYRPHYPRDLIAFLAAELSLIPESVVADVGSGTGISCLPFLEFGCRVFGVEPNDAMRREAERRLHDRVKFHSVPGRAEATLLADQSVDFVVAGQAFHWFDVEEARAEFRRILKPGGWVVLFWNTRRVDATPFLAAYEAMLQTYGTDYAKVQHRNLNGAYFARFFVHGYTRRVFEHREKRDFVSMRGGLLSSSYIPARTDAGFEPMLKNFEAIFAAHADQGQIELVYDTEVYFGRL